MYCGDSEAEVEAATVTALRAALASAGVDVSTVATILAVMQNTMDLAALATAAATDGLAAVLASDDKFASILADAGLDDSAVAAVAAAATAAEVEAVDRDGDEDAAPAPTKGNGGAVAGGIIAALGVVGMLVGGVLMYRDHQADANGGESSSGGSAGVSADVDAGAGAGTGTGSFYGAGGEAISFGRPSFQHGNSLSGSNLNGVTGVAVAGAAARRASEGSGYQGITLGRRKSSEGVVFKNPAYDQGEAPYNTNTNEVPGNAGWF